MDIEPRSRSIALAVALVALSATGNGTSRLPRAQGSEPANGWITAQEASSLPPVLVETLRQSPYAYFRRVNRIWNGRVCDAFSGESLPMVRLHGDAHVEQYALTGRAHGLDDFDDSAEGPAVVDLARFVGSLHVAAARRGWESGTNQAIDQFFRGYLQGLRDPAYRPPTPKVVERLRARRPPSPADFLASSERRMASASPQIESDARVALSLVAEQMESAPPGYFTLKRIGALQMGVGSYTTPKFLMRVEGPSPAVDDDVILEAKEVSDLMGAPCITTPDDGKAVRVIAGSRQIGRLRHEVLSVIRGLSSDPSTAREWWLRSWDRTYVEVRIPDLQSSQELEELAHDAGAQLGSASLPAASTTTATRQQELATISRLEPRIRTVAADLIRDMLEAWEQFRE
jgi:hypothetical protein